MHYSNCNPNVNLMCKNSREIRRLCLFSAYILSVVCLTGCMRLYSMVSCTLIEILLEYSMTVPFERRGYNRNEQIEENSELDLNDPGRCCCRTCITACRCKIHRPECVHRTFRFHGANLSRRITDLCERC